MAWGCADEVLVEADANVAVAVTLETCALPNLGYEIDRHLGPGEIVRQTVRMEMIR